MSRRTMTNMNPMRTSRLWTKAILSISRRGCIYEPQRELQRQLGGRYSYERLLSDREIQVSSKGIYPRAFPKWLPPSSPGCLRLAAVLQGVRKELLLGYDLFVKDDPGSPEWIYYDGLSDPVSLKEADMIRILDRLIAEHGLSYTESCFDRLDGKAVEKEKHPL